MKCKALLLSAALLLSVCPLTAYADTEPASEETTAAAEETQTTTERPKTEDGLYSYTILEDGTACLYMYLPTDYQGEIVVPSEVDGYTVTMIDEACFYETYSVTSIVIPATVTEIGPNAFFGCRSIQEFIVEEGNPYFTAEDGVLYANDGEYLICYPAGKTDETYTIADGVTEIAPGAFGFADDLKYVSMPDGVQFIDEWAFAYSGIEKIVLPDSMQEIGDYGFAFCAALTDIDFGKGLTHIRNASFFGCESLAEVTLPDGLLYAGQYAFAGTAMTSVTIPASMQSILYCAFGYDADYSKTGGFTIYGEAGSAAEAYCYETDEENDYENFFNFVDISNPEATTAHGAEDSAADPADTAEVTEADEENNQTTTVSKTNSRTMVMIGCLIVIAVLLVGLIFNLLHKPKPKKEHSAPKKEEDDI